MTDPAITHKMLRKENMIRYTARDALVSGDAEIPITEEDSEGANLPFQPVWAQEEA